MNRVAAAFALLLLAACATKPPSPAGFSFAILGDLAYGPREEAMFLETLRHIDEAAPAFVVHVGDFKGGGRCTDDVYLLRHAQLDASAAPLVYTPGDNEWTDCRREHMGAMDPVQRLARLRQIFFADGWSLGKRRIATAAQSQCLRPAPAGCGCAAHPENRQWIHSSVAFVTLNIPGSDNNVGFDAASDEEARCRNAANAAWLERAARTAEAAEVAAFVVIIHANPWDASRRNPRVYDGFLTQMRALPPRLRKPILFIHGDSHHYRVTPFNDAAGLPVDGITRLETYGTPFIGWVRVSYDPGKANPFGISPRLVGIVPPA